jgi:hypothetical protein
MSMFTLIDQARAETLLHYSVEQLDALRFLFGIAKRDQETSGGRVCARLLLGLYNGRRFPFDLTDLRLLDARCLRAAMVVLQMDAHRTWAEVHDVLDAALPVPVGKSTGHTLELWAKWMDLPGRCEGVSLGDLKARAA